MTDSTLTDSTVIDLPAAVSPDAGSSAIGSPLADAPSTDSSAAGSPLASSPSPDASPAVVLTPSAALIFAGHKGDWREKLFDLGAARETAPDPALRFWRSFAELFVGGLCRLPDDFGLERLAPPAEAQLQSLAAGAPPMAGGEYLSADSLAAVWGRLAQWTAEAAGRDWPDWLARRAPQWRRVGRVTFHLAENRSDPDKPFAFMASYVTSLTAEGRDRHLPLGQALRRYAGEGDRPALLRLLSPVRAAAEKLPWVAKMVADGTLYAPQAFTIGRAYRFLSDASSMEESGLTVRIPDWWRRRPQVKVAVSVGDGRPPSLGLKSLLDWDVSLALGDERLTPDEAAELLSAGSGLVFFKGQWLEVDPDRLSEALEHWRRVKASSGDGLGFIQAMRLLAGLPVEGRGGALELPEPGPWVGVRAGRALGELLAELRGPKAGRAPAGLKAELRPYQAEGLAWLSLLTSLGLGACLADDMGLGKTVQALALLLQVKERLDGPGAEPGDGSGAEPGDGSGAEPSLRRRASLLAAPASLLANWKAEVARFAPSLKVAFWHPSETPAETLAAWEARPEELLASHDLVVVSYAFLAKKADWFAGLQWRLAVLDEAQAVKNPASGWSRAARRLQAQGKVALTGTPVENRLLDLWSIFDFLNPGLFGSLKRFKEILASLEKRVEDQDRWGPLRRLAAPYLLRRLKTDRRVAADLPDKSEVDLNCRLTAAQATLYARVVEDLQKGLKRLQPAGGELGGESGVGVERRGLVLQALTRLRQVINHPAQLTGDGDWSSERSGKFQRLAELGRELAERQERLLVFSQFKEVIEPLAEHLRSVFGRPGLVLHGGVAVGRRRGLVEAFQAEDGPPFFVLSLKAGGVGLNLTAAGQVIHFDRWWNPAVEDQASDRAYRIGQRRNVLIHKCVTRGTLEERVDALLKKKRALADGVLGGEREIDLTGLDDGALMELVGLDLERAIL